MNTNKKKINRLRFGRLLAVTALLLTSGVVASNAEATTHKIQRPKLKRGSLIIEGTRASDKIALRLKAGNPRILQVDVRDDGKADFSFKRKQVARIVVHGGELATTSCASTNGTACSPTGSGCCSTAEPETTRSSAEPERRRCSAAPGTTWWTGTGGSDHCSSRCGRRHVRLGSRRREATSSTARPAPTPLGLQRRGRRRARLRFPRTVTHVRFARDVGNRGEDPSGLEGLDFHALGGPRRRHRRRSEGARRLARPEPRPLRHPRWGGRRRSARPRRGGTARMRTTRSSINGKHIERRRFPASVR